MYECVRAPTVFVNEPGPGVKLIGGEKKERGV